MSERETTTKRPRFGWILSALFWPALLFAAGLYGVVALSPKLQTYLKKRKAWHDRQERLVALERRVHYLQRVAKALEHDPEFKAEVARIELDASRPGDERLPVDSDLTLEAVNVPNSRPRGDEEPAYLFVIQQCAENKPLRQLLLGGAVLTVLFGFTYLHESQIGRIRKTAGVIIKTCGGIRTGCRWVSKRYRRKAPSDGGPWGVG